MGRCAVRVLPRACVRPACNFAPPSRTAGAAWPQLETTGAWPMATAAKAPASRDDLVSRARQCVDTFELPLALKFYERALDVAPDDCEVLDATGELLVRLGEPERAVPVLRRSIELQPNEGYAKYMNLGQFLSGAEALSCYEQGLALMDAHAEVLKARRAGSSKLSKKAARANDDELVELQQQMCAAHCAIAEVRARASIRGPSACPLRASHCQPAGLLTGLTPPPGLHAVCWQVFLTDLCDEPDAEQRCESAVQHALSLGESSPAAQAEALQALANLRLTQSRREEARTALTQVASLTAAAVDSGDLAKLPTHEFRTTTGKLLLEAEMPDAACDVLEQLLLEVRHALPMPAGAHSTHCTHWLIPPLPSTVAAVACRCGIRTRIPRSCAISRHLPPCGLKTARRLSDTSSGGRRSYVSGHQASVRRSCMSGAWHLRVHGGDVGVCSALKSSALMASAPLCLPCAHLALCRRAESFDQVHELLRDAGSRTPADAKPAAGRSRDGDAASADMMETDN